MPGSPSPAVAHNRARIAGLRRCIKAGEITADDPRLADAQRGLAFAKTADYIERVVKAAPPLTREQIDQLHVLLEPARRELTTLDGDHAA
jgi:hypothetical protein